MHGLDDFISRKRLAESLTAAGYPTEVATLSTMGSRGGGPPFRKYGSRAVYRWGDALNWAQARTSPVVSSLAELNELENAPEK